MEETSPPRLRQRRGVGEVGVVARRLAREGDVRGVMPVVDPLRVDAVAAGIARRDHDRIVQVALGDEGEGPAEVGGERIDGRGELGEDVLGLIA